MLHFVWVTDRETILGIRQATPCGQALVTAPLLLVVAADTVASRYPGLLMFDSGAAAEAVMAEAGRPGLAGVAMSLWLLEARTKGTAEVLKLPEAMMPEIMVAVGAPKDEAVTGSSVYPVDPSRVHWSS